MKYAADFRETARNALRGRWPVAVLTGFVASLIGAGIASAGGGSGSNSSNRVSRGELNDFFQSALWHQIKPVVITLLVLVFIWSIIQIIIGGAGKLGYAKFNLNLVDNKDAVFSDLFSQFDRLGAGFCMNFLTGLYIVLWTLLFIIPGIIKSFSYAMAPYLLNSDVEREDNQVQTDIHCGEQVIPQKKNKRKRVIVGFVILLLIAVIVLAFTKERSKRDIFIEEMEEERVDTSSEGDFHFDW